MLTNETYQRLAELDPGDVQYTYAYVSAERFQEAIIAACDGEHPDTVEALLHEALEATPGDGGNEGVIPCLGGEYNEVWIAWQKGE